MSDSFERDYKEALDKYNKLKLAIDTYNMAKNNGQ